jgi:hypothetical protein
VQVLLTLPWGPPLFWLGSDVLERLPEIPVYIVVIALNAATLYAMLAWLSGLKWKAAAR